MRVHIMKGGLIYFRAPGLLSPHLFVGRSTSSHEHNMETRESHDRNKEEPCDTHHHQPEHEGQGLTAASEVDDNTSRFTVALMKHAEKHMVYGRERIRDGGVQHQQPLPVVEDKDEAEGENSHHVNAQR